jgi:hypothetical protein
MPDLDDSTRSHALTRRSMLRGTAGAGAAGLAVSALAGITPASAATADAARPTAHRGAAGDAGHEEGDAGEAIVVYVRDAAAGDLEVYSGTSQVRIRDRALAARIVRASR